MNVTTEDVLNALVEYVALAAKEHSSPKTGSISDVSPILFGFALEDESEYASEPEQSNFVAHELSNRKEHVKFLLDALVEHKVEAKLTELLSLKTPFLGKKGSGRDSSTKQNFHPLYDEA